MTTNDPGSANQPPLFGCVSCIEYQTFPADHLRVFDGNCYCGDCWDAYPADDGTEWADLKPFVPAIQAECERLRKDADRLDWLADMSNPNGHVMLPTECVEMHLGDMRSAIDAAMEPSHDKSNHRPSRSDQKVRKRNRIPWIKTNDEPQGKGDFDLASKLNKMAEQRYTQRYAAMILDLKESKVRSICLRFGIKFNEPASNGKVE